MNNFVVCGLIKLSINISILYLFIVTHTIIELFVLDLLHYWSSDYIYYWSSYIFLPQIRSQQQHGKLLHAKHLAGCKKIKKL